MTTGDWRLDSSTRPSVASHALATCLGACGFVVSAEQQRVKQREGDTGGWCGRRPVLSAAFSQQSKSLAHIDTQVSRH